MKTLLLNHKQSLIFYSLSFLVPFLIMAAVLWSKDIYWGSETTILASDGFHQYAIFANQLRNILHGSDSIFYTFTSGLGLNFYALISYYLGSFLSPLYFFFTVASIPDAVYLFTLIKFGLIGLTMALALRRRFTNLSSWLILSQSTAYALMGFAVSQLEINTWLDVFILAPLILLGLHNLIEQSKLTLYYISLSLLFIQNYYFGFMMAIFLVLYFLTQLTRLSSWRDGLRAIRHFSLVSLFAALTACVMLIPTYLDLSTHGEEFTEITNLWTENSWYFDLIAKNFIGAYDTTKFGAIPMIYVGILPLILALMFFFSKTIKWPVKIAYALLLLVFILSFYLNPLDLLWQGMHAPNMFLHRYAWLFSTLIIFMAAETLDQFSHLTLKRLYFPLSLLATAFIITILFSQHYKFVNPVNITLTVAFFIAYATILLAFKKNQLTGRHFLIVLLAFTFFEASLNTYYYIDGLEKEWVFPSREGYYRDIGDITKLVNKAKSQETTFFRMERDLPQTGNDSMKFNYNGISQFSSIRNTASSHVLDRLGFQSFGTNLNLRYQNNTLIADSLFGVSYNLASSPMKKYGFELVEQSGSQRLYHNQNASQLAILTNQPYQNRKFSINTLDNQTDWLNYLSGSNYNYFTRLPYQWKNSTELSTIGKVSAISKDFEDAVNISFTVTVPAHQQVYISVPNITYSNPNTSSLSISVNDQLTNYTTDNAYSFFDLGYYASTTKLTVTMTFPDNQQVSFDQPTVYGLDTQSYQKAMNAITNKSVKVNTHHNKVTARFTSQKASSLLFTLPYDKGWSAKLNGKAVPIRKVQGGFMAVDVPKGKGTVSLSFVPEGLLPSSGLSLLGILLFISYVGLHRLLRQKSAQK